MRRLILFLVSHYALDILEDAYDLGFVDGYKVGRSDDEFLTLEELEEYLKVGGTD